MHENNRQYQRELETKPFYIEKTEGMYHFYTKTLPVLFIGMLLWMFSTLSYGGVITNDVLKIDNIFVLLGAYIGYFIGWIVTIVLAMKQENTGAMLLFWATSFVSGIVQAPIIVWASYMLGSVRAAGQVFFIASFMGVMATSAALFAGKYFGTRISDRLGYAALIGLIIGSIAESIIFLLIPFNFLILGISLFMFSMLFITILYDGAHLKEQIEHSWMLACVTIFIDIMVMIIRIFIILVTILADR